LLKLLYAVSRDGRRPTARQGRTHRLRASQAINCFMSVMRRGFGAFD
jgi:hypothetical protein